MTSVRRQVGKVLCRSAGLQVAALIGEAYDRVGVSHIAPLRIRARRIKVDAEGVIQPAGKEGHLLGLAVAGDTAEDSNVTGLGLSHENVAVGSSANDPRTVESSGVLLHFEAVRNLRPRAFGTGHNLGAIAPRGSREGCGKVFQCKFANLSGLLI